MISNIKMSLKTSLVIIVVVGILLGNVFVFGISYWYETVSREDCITVNAIYNSFDDYYRNTTHEIQLYFFDYEQQTIIEDTIATEELINVLEQTPTNTKAVMLLHPNSEIVLEITINDNQLFGFELTMKQLDSERTFFVIFGCSFYLASVAAGIKLITMRKKK